MVYLDSIGKKGCIIDDYSEMELVSDKPVLIDGKYPYFSLLNITGCARGITIKGAKYLLENAKLEKSMPSFAISNEVAENFAMVSCKKGGLFLIESKELSK